MGRPSKTQPQDSTTETDTTEVGVTVPEVTTPEEPNMFDVAEEKPANPNVIESRDAVTNTKVTLLKGAVVAVADHSDPKVSRVFVAGSELLLIGTPDSFKAQLGW